MSTFGVESSFPADQECANCEGLGAGGGREDGRCCTASHSWGSCHQFSYQTKGGQRKRIGSLRNSDGESHHARYVVLQELGLRDERRQ